MSELYAISIFLLLFLSLALNVVISQNPVYSILYLVLFFVAGSVLLLLLGYDFFALVFVLVYVGAIAVLFLFVIMILDIKIVHKAEFNALYLVALGFLLFLLPYLFNVFVLLLVLQDYVYSFYAVFPFYGYLAAINDPIFHYLDDMVFFHFDKELHSCLKSLVTTEFDPLAVYSEYLEGFRILRAGWVNLMIYLKPYFGYGASPCLEAPAFLQGALYVIKVDHGSSVKSLQALYTHFTSVFVLSGGVLLVAMTSCISLTLPSRQESPARLVRRRFKEKT